MIDAPFKAFIVPEAIRCNLSSKFVNILKYENIHKNNYIGVFLVLRPSCNQNYEFCRAVSWDLKFGKDIPSLNVIWS